MSLKPNGNAVSQDALRSALSKPILEDARARHSAFYAPGTNIDRRSSKGRKVPMGVLNLSMPRTGTMVRSSHRR